AQTLKPPLLELLRQLMNYESNDQKFLQVALFAQEEFRARLQQARFRNLVSRTAMASTLDVLSLAETAAMLRHRWMVAGGKRFPFTDDAVEAIYRLARGAPRTEVILADNALLVAYLANQSTIDSDIIQQVVADRGLPDTAPVTTHAVTVNRRGARRRAT
ncbi:MAG: hypothetical protein NZ518_08260, partial [Dehalococcoidia bacterium]|nr:hypothetical protein [Dehalococcoidia bacterium]